MKSSIYNKILIIQSLGPCDRNTGRVISDDVVIQVAVHTNNTSVELENIHTKQELFKLFDVLIENALTEKIYPILHFEVHGYEEGISLSNGQDVLFEELKPYFTKLNHAAKFNLFVIFGACHAAHIINIIQSAFPSPVWGVLAPVELIDTDSLLNGFPEFYGEFIKTGNVLKAIKKLTPDHSLNDPPFYFTSAEQLFSKSIKPYTESRENDQDLKLLADRTYNFLAAKGIYIQNMSEFTEYIKNDLPDFIVETMENFFMLKDYPENFHRLMFSELYLGVHVHK